LIKNKSSFSPSFSFFLFLIYAKNPFVFADGFVVVLPATEGAVLFFTKVGLFVLDDKLGAVLFPFIPFT
jgi:hypothetical protein